MNLRDLQYLVAVANHLHFGKAARALHVSQPTLSMQLKKLEDALGVQLFERTNKQVMLTSAGAEITARAKRVLGEAEQLVLTAKAARDPGVGQLRLGIFPTLAPYLLPGLMPRLGEQFPRLSLQLVEERTPELVRQLEAGTIDAALLAMPVEHFRFSHAALFEEPFLLAAPKQHPLAARQRVTLADMRGATMLLLEDGHCLREQALEVCQLAGVGEAPSFRATSLETLRHMVAASHDSVTLIPELATRGQHAALRYIPFADPPPSRSIGLFWRTASARAPLYKTMAEAIANAYVKLHIAT